MSAEIRERALEWSVRSYVDLAQPNNTDDYEPVYWEPPTASKILKRAKLFADFIENGDVPE